MTARFSRLPVLQYCGQAQRLGELGAGSRASAIGTAFHAKCSEAPEFEQHYARLTPEERDLVDVLIRPTPITVNDVELSYDTAHKERKVSLVNSSGEVVCAGTADLYWLHDGILYCADIKRTSFTAPDGPRSLQVIGYAHALCEELGAAGYFPGIWDATEGEWQWGEYVETLTEQYEENHATLVAAAMNAGGEYNVGPHCGQCYARKQCPQYLMPLELAETSLAPFTAPGGITNENAAEALLLAKRAADTADAVIDRIKQHVKDNGAVVHEATGKMWRGKEQRGRAGLDSKALEADHPELVQRYTKFGNPFSVYRWVNIEGKKKSKKAKDEAL